MCALKVANQEDNVGKKAESTTREDDHRTLSEIDQWLYLFPTEDDQLHGDNAVTPPSSSSSLMSSFSREMEMSAIVSALTHVVAGNVPPRQYGGGDGSGAGGEGTSNSSSSSGQKRRREVEEGGGNGGKAVKAANTLTVDQYFSGGSSTSKGKFCYNTQHMIYDTVAALIQITVREYVFLGMVLIHQHKYILN